MLRFASVNSQLHHIMMVRLLKIVFSHESTLLIIDWLDSNQVWFCGAYMVLNEQLKRSLTTSCFKLYVLQLTLSGKQNVCLTSCFILKLI